MREGCAMTKKTHATITVLAILAIGCFGLAATSSAAEPVLMFSDILNGPKSGLGDGRGQGSIVTIWGNNLGSLQGDSRVYFKDSNNQMHEAAYVYYWKNANGRLPGGPSDLYTHHRMQEIALSIPSSAADGAGKIFVKVNATNSNELDFFVNSGHIHFATNRNCSPETGSGTYADPWCHAQSFYLQIVAGDILYLMDGTYTGQYCSGTYANRQCMTGKAGTSTAAVAWIAYPSQRVTWLWSGKHFQFKNISNETRAHYQTVSKLVLDGNGGNTGGVEWGGWYLSEDSGPEYVRVVGLRITNSQKGESSAMTGMVNVNGDYGKVLGVEFHEIGNKGAPKNNDHLVYMQGGVDNVEVAYNNIHDNSLGHCFQIHADGGGNLLYENIREHSNYITSKHNPGDMRGPTISLVKSGSTVYFYNNVVDRTGRQAGFQVWGPGTAYVLNNTFYGVGGDGVLSQMSTNGMLIAQGNILLSNGVAPYVYRSAGSWDFVSLSNNLYFENGSGPSQDSNAVDSDPNLVDPLNGDFRLQGASFAIDRGMNLSDYFTVDFEGRIRLSGSAPDIGAYEYDSGYNEDRIPPSAPRGLR